MNDTHFPHAILPNKLLQELNGLMKQADLAGPLVDEIAADIFMGGFSDKFSKAFKVTSTLLSDSLYERYYDIEYQPQKPKRKIFNRQTTEDFSQRCRTRAGSSRKGWSVAANGLVIEQQQILTTQNLAVLFSQLELKQEIEDLGQLAIRCFEWICVRQQAAFPSYHAGLITMKNTAYAWRQMLFFMSLMTEEDLAIVAQHINQHFNSRPTNFKVRFQPVLRGLNAVLNGGKATNRGSMVFLGWAVGGHPLMAERTEHI